ncbi:MAG: hydrogenase maturation nickel metallochaperone HypA [Candidatus Kapabacteria bacterium]|nr:hydrogenase maturation nickel metallochaperone HypA [Candidatus Kapabacteria bacterium]
MHEVSIASEIIEIVRQNLPDGFDNKVKSVKLDLGEFTNIVPEALKFGFEVLTEGTELDGAQLIMNILPLKIECQICENVSLTEPGYFFCVKCGTDKVNIISGKEMKVVEIEIYD